MSTPTLHSSSLVDKQYQHHLYASSSSLDKEKESPEQRDFFFRSRGFSVPNDAGLLAIAGQSVESLCQRFGTPLIVVNEALLRSQFRLLADSFSPSSKSLKNIKFGIHYAMKSNFNPTILRILEEEGARIDAVSPLECELALKVGFSPERILFTGNNIGLDDLRYCLERNIQVNIESLCTLDAYGEFLDQLDNSTATERGAPRPVSIRVNPDVGAAHHSHCITGGPSSKFGIYPQQLGEMFEILRKHNLTLVGLHAHIGSGILEPGPMEQALDIVLNIARGLIQQGRQEEVDYNHNKLVALEWVDVGGGFGIPYSPMETTLDVPTLAHRMADKFARFYQELTTTTKTNKDEEELVLELRIEPGRFLVASSSTLITTVTNVKSNPCYHFVGVDTGMNHLIRPMLYSAYHHILNASSVNPIVTSPTIPGKEVEIQQDSSGEEGYVIVGNICETGDVLSGKLEGDLGDIHHGEARWKPRWLPIVEVGHRLAFCDVGAYGMAMSSQYNLRARPAEVLVRQQSTNETGEGEAEEEAVLLIRKRETLDDILISCVDPQLKKTKRNTPKGL